MKFSYTANLEIMRDVRKQNGCFLLYEGDGVWKQLKVRKKLKKFYEDRWRQACIFEHKQPQQFDTGGNENVQQNVTRWFKINCPNNRRVFTALQMLSSDCDYMPSVKLKLFALIWRCLERHDYVGDAHNIAVEIVALVERVVDYNSRNVDPVFYLHTVANYCPHRWKCEFLLQEMEERMLTVLDLEERNRWRKTLFKLSDSVVTTLRERLISVSHEGMHIIKNKLERILAIFDKDFNFKKEDAVMRLGQLSLNDWNFELKIKIWENRVEQLSTIGEEDRSKAVYLFLELENRKGETFCHKLIDDAPKLITLQKLWENVTELEAESRDKRTFEEIINVMREDANTSQGVVDQLQNVETQVQLSFNFPQRLVDMKKEDEDDWSGKFITFKDIRSWSTSYVKNRDRFKENDLFPFDSKYHNFCSSIMPAADKPLTDAEFLYIFDRAVQLVLPRKEGGEKCKLLDTQRVTILTLLANKGSVLAQVSTGEGKSLIVAGVAIFRALHGQKVDVITSNNVLAIRDSTLSAAHGGLCDLYAAFGVTVANNCSQLVDDRIRAYDSAIVYGELSNFQRDYLLHEFYERNIRGDRTFQCVIVDEVDCMLLDRGNNMLYLSHDIPGMEMLESLYVFIWQKICTSTDTLEQIKSAVLFDLYGVINKNDLISVHSSLEDRMVDLNAIWVHLIESDVIDHQGRFLITDVQQIPEMATTDIVNLRAKLVFFFRRIAGRQRRIRIPQQLLPFVDHHLDSWLENAWRAFHELKLDTDYVISLDRTGASSDVNPQVIIIDPDTGMDQVSSQWDKALHQFLQLKEGCQITMQSLKAVFISNVNYIKRYNKLYGVSGTLGSKVERKFLKETYECDYFTVPTAFPRDFTLKPSKVFVTVDTWLDYITKETQETISALDGKNLPRSILIFCGSINEVKVVHRHIKKVLKLTDDKIHRYTRDYQKFAFESSRLNTGHVIVATNLAGRGTDIKLTSQLRRNGGLHICLTYLPNNERIEEQAMGRAGRQGDPGSGILILCRDQPYEAGEVDEQGVWNRGKSINLCIY